MAVVWYGVVWCGRGGGEAWVYQGGGSEGEGEHGESGGEGVLDEAVSLELGGVLFLLLLVVAGIIKHYGHYNRHHTCK